jgi:hypothetical protein
LRKKNSSPRGIAATTQSTECAKANEQETSPIALALTASAASAALRLSRGWSSSTNSEKAGGGTVNDNDCFVAKEGMQHVQRAKELWAQANIQIQAEKQARAAQAIVEKKTPSKHVISDLKALIAWRKGKPFPSKVNEFIASWTKAKKIPIPTFEVWTEAEDKQALVVKLEETVELEGAIVLEDVDCCGRLARQRQRKRMASATDMR